MKTYRIRYSDKLGDYVEDHMAASPISALDWFHRQMQRKDGKAPTDYKLHSLMLIYGAGTKGGSPIVESSFDLPKSGNPDVRIPIEEPTSLETKGMDFLETTIGGKLSD